MLAMLVLLLGLCACGHAANEPQVNGSVFPLNTAAPEPVELDGSQSADGAVTVDLHQPFFINASLLFDKGHAQVAAWDFSNQTQQIAGDRPILPVHTPSALDVLDPQAMAAIDPDRPVIALTFDDGPGPYTQQLLNILSANNARATFFVVGNRIKSYPEVMRAIAAQGSEIANHSWAHADLADLDEQGIREQLQWTVDEVEKYTGIRPKLMRPPYGSMDDLAVSVTRDLGMPIITWSLDTRDWQTKDAQKTYDAIISSVRNGTIILCHDIHQATIESMAKVVPALVKAGYQLVTVSQLLTLVDGGAVAGQVYNSVHW